MDELIALARQILGILVGTLLPNLAETLGLTRITAKEHTEYHINDVVDDLGQRARTEQTSLDTISTNVNATKTDLDDMRTGPLLTLQSVIDAMPGTGPVTLPTTPPAGYGGFAPADVWQVPLGLPSWDWEGGGEAAEAHVTHAGAYARSMMMGAGLVCPGAPDFVLVCTGYEGLEFTPYHLYPSGFAGPTGIDWSTWDGSQTIVAFLNANTSGITWNYTNLYGETTPGWAWGHIPGDNVQRIWRCLVSDDMLPAKAGVVPGGIQKTQDYTALGIAIGLASLFAVGGGDVSAIVEELVALLADSSDITAALTSLMDWLSGRDQTTNQEQTTALATVTDDVTALTDAGTHTIQSVLSPLAQLAIDELDHYNHLTDASSLNLRNLEDQLEAIRTGNNLTLQSALDAISTLSDKIDSLKVPPGGYPGSDAVTFGDPIDITPDMTIDGPIDGILYNVTGAPTTLAKSVIGGHTSWMRLGQGAFVSDDGSLDSFQQLNWDQGVLVPKAISRPASLVLHWAGGVTGSVTPWVRT